MGIPDPRHPKDPQQHPRRQRKDPKMCNPQQQSPPQNAAWQGVYPDLSALNELFSTQATAATPGQTSPWIGFLASLGPQATCSTLPSPSSTLSAPSSSSCPACTSCMFEASPWEILLAGVSGSPAPTQLGTNMGATTTSTDFLFNQVYSP